MKPNIRTYPYLLSFLLCSTHLPAAHADGPLEASLVLPIVERATSHPTYENMQPAIDAVSRLDPAAWEAFRHGIRELNHRLKHDPGPLGDVPLRTMLGRILASGLTVDQAVTILSEDMFDLDRPFDRYLFAESITQIQNIETKCEEIVPELEELLNLFMSMRADLDHPALYAVEAIITALGKCGEEGSAILRELDDFESWRFPALARTRSDTNMQYLLNQFQNHPVEQVRDAALATIAHHLEYYDDAVRQQVSTEILTLGASQEGDHRRRAAELAGFTGDPELLPFLEALLDSDPHVRVVNRDGIEEETYPVRNAAEFAIDRILRRMDPIYRERRSNMTNLERHIFHLAGQAKRIHDAIAAGADTPENQARLQHLQTELDKYHAELSQLQNQQPQPTP